ncbi:hypothetical protein RJ639_036523 [Escallonia herrerae]|uniref:Pre-PUA domain-containing protein n=1 Tax=Escallonia herrerae TaxID=1293975 RepID=A0AA88WUV8_9ASTE|nr:hypothetical protein RJ639_036523 [Escallonia herrerae]
MFKKWVEPKSQQRLSGADRKKLKRSIKDRFPNASDADIDVLLPPKACLSGSLVEQSIHGCGRFQGWIDEDHKRMKKGGVHVLRSVEMEGWPMGIWQ